MQRPVHLNYRKNGQQIDPLACMPLLIIQAHHVKGMSSAIHRLNVDTIRQRQYHFIPYIVQHLAYFQHIVGTRKIFLIGLVNWFWEKKNQEIGSCIQYNKGFPGVTSGKESAYSTGDAGDVGLTPGSGRSPRGGNGNPLQYSFWNNSMDRGTWQAAIHGVTNSWTPLSTHTFNITT